MAQCLTTRTGSMYDPTMETLPVTAGSLCARTGQSISVQDAAQSHLLPIAFDAQNSANQGVGTDCYNGTITGDLAATLGTRGSSTTASGPTVMVSSQVRRLAPIAFGAQNSANQGDSVSTEVTTTLDKSKTPAVAMSSAVRRLTPTECERLQGFPDNFTQIPWRNKPAEDCPDGPRYKAMGNSMAVPVMRWIGERIDAVEGIDQ